MRIGWWHRERATQTGEAAPPSGQVVLALTQPLNRDTARQLVESVRRVQPGTNVVIDVTAVPSFDSEGASELLTLAEQADERVTIVGFRQAAARLLGEVDTVVDGLPVAPAGGWKLRHLHNLAVICAEDYTAPSTDTLEPMLGYALQEEVGIVVLDLRGAPRLTPVGVQAIAFASSAAAVRGQELLVVNVDAHAAALLRGAGLSATTFVAPEQLPGG
jgi:anti-anti-sigma regulatory factor